MRDIDMYINDISDFQILTPDEERKLAIRVSKGDELARKQLIEANLRLVIYLAKKYTKYGVPLSDLVQEGNLGLIKAVEKFDVSKGFRFSTYATWWITQSITRSIPHQNRNIKIPIHVIEQVNRLKSIQRELSVKLEHEPSTTEIAKKMKLSVAEVEILIDYITDTTSLDVQIGEDEDCTIGSLIQDTHAANPEESFIQKEEKDILQIILDTLTDRESKILKMRFGIDVDYSKTLEEVGDKFNVTRERIRQIEAKALKKLRQPKRLEALKCLVN